MTNYGVAMVEKLFDRSDISRQDDNDNPDFPRDISTYEQTKKIGLFIVQDTNAISDYDVPEINFNLRRGDSCLELHLPTVPKGLRSHKAGADSLNLIQDYIFTHNLHPRYVMGVTYGKLAGIARRYFDFGTARVEVDRLPPEVTESIRHSCEDSGNELGVEDIGQLAVIVFHSVSYSNNNRVLDHQLIINLCGFHSQYHASLATALAVVK